MGPSEKPGNNSTLMSTAPHRVVGLVAALALSACHPGNQEAKQLRAACEAGDAAACTKFAVKLRKGEYVLRDEKPRTPGEEGLRDMILMDAIYRTAKDRRTVSL